MITGDRAKASVDRWAAAQHRPMHLELRTAEGHPLSGELAGFCRWLAGSCGMVRVREGDAGENGPGLFLRQGTVVYRAVPGGTELEPFLEALATDPLPGDFRTAAMRIHVAAACPHCPAAVRSLLPLTAGGGPLTLQVIDSEARPDLAEADGAKSVPTLILDDAFRWTGALAAGDLEALLTTRDRTVLEAGTLERLLENGNAGPLADLMAAGRRISPALGRLLAGEAMSTRLGAMMVVEDLLERAPALVEQFVPVLWDLFDAAPEPAQGDMLYVIGEAGAAEMAGRIDRFIATGPHPEVAEAGREALARISERHR